MRRSPSPSISASTLSTCFNGGGNGGGGSGGVEDIAMRAAEKLMNHLNNNERKDEWATELQTIPSALENIGSAGERCGLGLEDWEQMLAEPSQEQSLFRWIAGDVVEDTPFGLKQLLQCRNNQHDFDGNGAGGLGAVDEGPAGFVAISGVSSIGNNLVAFPGSGFATANSNNNGNGKVGSNLISPNSSVLANYKSVVGLGNANNNNNSMQNLVFGSPTNSVSVPVSLSHGVLLHHSQHQELEAPDTKPQILNPQVLMNQQQSHLPHPQIPNFFLPLSFPQQESHLFQPQHKRHSPGGLDPIAQIIPELPLSDPGHEFLRRKQQHHLGFPQGVQLFHPHHQKPLVVKKELGVQQHHQLQQQQQQPQHALLDQLYKAAELVGTGNFSHAQGILARLNQQLSPIGKPLYRAAFYFKEALQLLLLTNSNPAASQPPRSPTPIDVFFKIGAYKVFSEVSPLIQFINFTCNQTLLEALNDADRVHIIDFDIGFGAQWASFMRELPRNRGAPSLKITAFASSSTHHPVELVLMRENLTQLANEIGVSFDLDVINFDSLEKNCYSLPIFGSKQHESVAVNFPIWSCSNQPSTLPSILRIVKQLSPKIVVSLDRGCDRSDLPFPQHIRHALQSYIHLLESLDAVNVTTDAVNKIERFILQPKIESTVLGRLRTPEKMPNWKTIFASAGFSPVTFSNYTETQAECVLQRSQVRGFHVEKRQALLVLFWQHRELISASAWRC